ncbi:FmdB family transcriptional regulator [Candidatus Nitrosoglobus terrae]|uniref:FmdB family transcriptional regulator n=1 Tax=Candidatus Nitrosoglobus terrae TaxID=1630141 RepID=A0A1Q2SPR9_9GAMM|nr:zinc ribbon domain-containing protein [Candidatus Nitrosoglobus terrae]BAW81111.1 FmdB family transcriptional regulator [Candidatus Nitrosoglobus terrae]
MPIYEYRCESCSHEVELLQKLTDAPAVRCPSCSEDKLRKLVSAAGFRLKGGGWYETDFKNSNKRNVVASGDGPKEKESAEKAPDHSGSAETNANPKKDAATSTTATN